ncbi:MAG: four helix bundle protein [Candidatus Omnitrophica bacterium]|nr:four helix bundle protein [Candidatus Omnitrophota bacterium]
MNIKSFEDLEVWKVGYQATLDIYRITKDFPEEEKFALVTQIRRSSSSICANIAEGYRKTTKEFIRYAMIAQGSVQETKHHLLLSRDLGYSSREKINKLLVLMDRIGKMLSALVKGLRKKT